MEKKLLLALWFFWAGAITVQAAAPAMKSYAIDLPNHILRFSLPEEIARKIGPGKIAQRFDPAESSFIKNGFRQVVGTLYDINGPVWIGPYGSLKINFVVQKKLGEYAGGPATVEDLEQYVRRKLIRGAMTQDAVVTLSILNGAPAVKRHWSTFADPDETEPEDLEIFSLPLNSEMFLDVGFNVMAWEDGRGKESKWKAKVEALREVIKATVVLEPK